MTKPKHVPECFNGRQRSGGLPCICDRLRACEQRVLLSKPNIELSAVYGYEAGYADGVQAALDKVTALMEATTDEQHALAYTNVLNALRGSGGLAVDEYERGLQDAYNAVAALDLHRDSGTILGCVYVPDALAAIDALRGES